MSYPAERNRRRSSRPASIRASRRRRQREVSDGIFREPLLDENDYRHHYPVIHSSTSPRGHVELMNVRDNPIIEMGGGGYRPPALDNNLPIVEGLVVQQQHNYRPSSAPL